MPNDFDFVDPDEEDTTEEVEQTPAPQAKDTAQLDKMKGYTKRVEKELAASKKETAELKARWAEAESKAKANALTAAGLNEKQAQAFLALNPDNPEVTPEAIQAFRSEVLGIGEPPEPTGFGPTDVSGERSTGGNFYTRHEFEQIMRENPAKGEQIAASGKVRWNNL